jgi:hypothetical protein
MTECESSVAELLVTAEALPSVEDRILRRVAAGVGETVKISNVGDGRWRVNVYVEVVEPGHCVRCSRIAHSYYVVEKSDAPDGLEFR